MTAQAAPTPGSRTGRVNLFDRLAIVFFTFPLLAPAINETVVYPFLLAGLVLFAGHRFGKLELRYVLVASVLIAPCVVGDPITCLRLLSFYLSCVFFAYVCASEARLNFMLAAGMVHAVIVCVQFALLWAGVELDFSVLLRAIYGPLLPGTGTHIDYNAFSQLDIFFPRVAGINREPAFAAVLFLGLGFIAMQRRRTGYAWLFLLATLFSLSKVVFALIPSYALLYWSLRRPEKAGGGWGVLSNVLIFIASQAVFYLGIYLFSEPVAGLAALDASFYHRIIGHLTVATDPGSFNILGSSWAEMSRQAAFADYEFKDFQRGFFDGSVVAKLLLDFGWVITLFYVVAVSALARNWQSVLALSIGGMFINLLSVSPATVITFMNLCALPYLLSAPLHRGTRPLIPSPHPVSP